MLVTLGPSALFQQEKWIPLWALNGGLEINLTLARPADVMRVVEAGTQPTQSTSYALSEIAMLISLCTLDDSLQEAYNAKMLQGGNLMIHTQGWSHQQSFLSAPAPTGDFGVSMTKPFSRLGNMFVAMAPELSQQGGRQYANTFVWYRQTSINV